MVTYDSRVCVAQRLTSQLNRPLAEINVPAWRRMELSSRQPVGEAEEFWAKRVGWGLRFLYANSLGET